MAIPFALFFLVGPMLLHLPGMGGTPVHLEEDGTPITIDSDAELVQEAGSNGWPGNGSIGDPFIISGLSIHTGSAANCIFLGNTSSHLVLRDLVLGGAKDRGLITAQGSGIALFHATNVTLDNCSSRENEGAGISLIGCRNVVMDGCRTTLNTRYGVSVQNSEDVQVIDCSVELEKGVGYDSNGIRNLTMVNCSGSRIPSPAIQLRGDVDVVSITGCVITSSDIGISAMGDFVDMEIGDCRFEWDRYGIILSGGLDIHISNTTILESIDTAITARNTDDLSIIRTTLRNGTTGIRLANVSDGSISDSTVLGNYIGIQVTEEGHGTVIERNLIAMCNSQGARLAGASYVTLTNNTFIYNAGTGDNLAPGLYQADDDSSSNVWSMNHFRDHRWPDADRDGTVDVPYPDKSGALDGIPRANQITPSIGPPSGLRTTSIKGGIRVEWDVHDEAHGYRVFRADGVGSEPLLVKETADERMDDRSLPDESPYYYWICSMGRDGLPSEPAGPSAGRADREGPLIKILEPIDGSYLSDDPLTVNWAASDGVTSVKSLTLKLDGFLVPGTPLVGPFKLKGVAEGVHELEIASADLNGNVREASISFTMDRSRPSIEIIHPAEGLMWNENWIRVRWDVVDGLSPIASVHYRLDGGGWSPPPDGSINISGLPDGGHEVAIKAVDLAGNSNEVNASFTIDTVRPKVISIEPTDVVKDPTTSIRVRFNEPMNRSSLRIEVEGCTGRTRTSDTSVSFEVDGGLEFGNTYRTYVYGKDPAGNEVERRWTFETISDFGSLLVIVVDIDGQPIGNVPAFENGTWMGSSGQDGVLLLRLPSGYHTFELNRSGYEPFSFKVMVKREMTTDMGSVVLERIYIPVPGWVHIKVIDSRGYPKDDAMVFVNGMFANRTDGEGQLSIMVWKGVYDIYAEYNHLQTNEITINVSVDGFNGTYTLILVDLESVDPMSNQNLPLLIMIPILVLSLVVLVLINLVRRSKGKRPPSTIGREDGPRPRDRKRPPEGPDRSRG